jgi:hypothetical protein
VEKEGRYDADYGPDKGICFPGLIKKYDCKKTKIVVGYGRGRELLFDYLPECLCDK